MGIGFHLLGGPLSLSEKSSREERKKNKSDRPDDRADVIAFGELVL
jgi:hypothetical protein